MFTLTSVLSLPLAYAQTPGQERPDERLEKAKQAIESFEKAKSLGAADTALRLLVVKDLLSADRTKRMEQRSNCSRLWAGIFHEIESQRDPAFDPQSPTSLPSLTLLPGMEPETFKKPEGQTFLQKAADDNHKKVVQSEYQEGLRRLDEEAESEFKLFTKRYYTNSERPELEQLLKSGGLSSTRTQSLLDMAFHQ